MFSESKPVFIIYMRGWLWTSLTHIKGRKELRLRSLPWLKRTVSLKPAFKLYINLQYNYVGQNITSRQLTCLQ